MLQTDLRLLKPFGDGGEGKVERAGALARTRELALRSLLSEPPVRAFSGPTPLIYMIFTSLSPLNLFYNLT